MKYETGQKVIDVIVAIIIVVFTLIFIAIKE